MNYRNKMLQQHDNNSSNVLLGNEHAEFSDVENQSHKRISHFDTYQENEGNPDGIEIQLCVLKSKVRMLRSQMNQIKKSKAESDNAAKFLETELKKALSDNACLEKKLSQVSKICENEQSLKEKCEKIEIENDTLRKEVDESRTLLQEAYSKKEDKLDQALKQIELLKKTINNSSKGQSDSETKQERDNFLATIANLEKQKGNLLMAVKKQMKLIDLMKQQRVHLEASRLLSFTEAEFTKIIDWKVK